MVNEIRWKIVAVTAIISMVISLLSGGLAGIRLGTLLFRATIGGVVFALLAVGMNLFILRFFPEILTSIDTAEDDSITGSRVDIMTEDDAEGDLIRSSVGLDAVPADDMAVDRSSSTPGGKGSTSIGELGDEESEESAGEPVGDLDRFSDAFSDVEKEKSSSSRSSSDAPDGDYDPEEMARAIHTVMKRDEKG